jgi:hypothetical protein
VAVIALILAYKSHLFDARAQRLDAQRIQLELRLEKLRDEEERIENDILSLQQREDGLRRTIDSLYIAVYNHLTSDNMSEVGFNGLVSGLIALFRQDVSREERVEQLKHAAQDRDHPQVSNVALFILSEVNRDVVAREQLVHSLLAEIDALAVGTSAASDGTGYNPLLRSRFSILLADEWSATDRSKIMARWEGALRTSANSLGWLSDTLAVGRWILSPTTRIDDLVSVDACTVMGIGAQMRSIIGHDESPWAVRFDLPPKIMARLTPQAYLAMIADYMVNRDPAEFRNTTFVQGGEFLHVIPPYAKQMCQTDWPDGIPKMQFAYPEEADALVDQWRTWIVANGAALSPWQGTDYLEACNNPEVAKRVLRRRFR